MADSFLRANRNGVKRLTSTPTVVSSNVVYGDVSAKAAMAAALTFTRLDKEKAGCCVLNVSVRGRMPHYGSEITAQSSTEEKAFVGSTR